MVDQSEKGTHWLQIASTAVLFAIIVALPWPGTGPRRLPLPAPGKAVTEAFGPCLDDGPYEQAVLDVHRLPSRAAAGSARYRILLVPIPAHGHAPTAALEFDTYLRQLRPADPLTAQLLTRSGCPPAYWPATAGFS